MADVPELPKVAKITTKITAYSQLPSEHPFYGLVGRVASEWSHLEHKLDGIIYQLLTWDTSGLPQAHVACITSQIMTVAARCSAILSLCIIKRLDEETICKPIRRLKQDSFMISEYRNRIVHDPWFAEQGSESATQFKSMPSSDPRWGFYDIESEKINNAIVEIKNLHDRTNEIHRSIIIALQSS